ncbi:hypothetical protein L484_001608 [Morus notabilis]|uniref:Uncharacterized protein n=1 Tax=Morus notabilis TaxID=981085 RepID=W9RT14_9ROSA|nr:hypothetical protein L484_001608 [Morus notabilis]
MEKIKKTPWRTPTHSGGNLSNLGFFVEGELSSLVAAFSSFLHSLTLAPMAKFLGAAIGRHDGSINVDDHSLGNSFLPFLTVLVATMEHGCLQIFWKLMCSFGCLVVERRLGRFLIVLGSDR